MDLAQKNAPEDAFFLLCTLTCYGIDCIGHRQGRVGGRGVTWRHQDLYHRR